MWSMRRALHCSASTLGGVWGKLGDNSTGGPVVSIVCRMVGPGMRQDSWGKSTRGRLQENFPEHPLCKSALELPGCWCYQLRSRDALASPQLAALQDLS